MNTYTKHEDEWCILSTEKLKRGQMVVMTKKDGSENEVIVGDFITSRDNDKKIYEILSTKPEPRHTGKTYTYVGDDWPE